MLFRECQSPRRRYCRLAIVLAFALFVAGCNSSASLIAKGEEYLQKRKFHAALMQFRSAAEADPNSASAHWGMARAYEKLGQFNETVEELRKTTELDGANLEAKARLGNYFLLVQPPLVAETQKLRDEILSADNGFIEGHILSASILAAQNRPDDEVIGAVNHAISLDPQRIESYVSLQRLYMTREKAGEAEAAIKKGIANRPDAVVGRIEYGRFLMYSNRDQEAEREFNIGIEADPSNIEAREAIAEFFMTSRQMAKAENAYLELARIQENSPESRLDLAKFYSRADRTEDSIRTLQQILEVDPDYALARYKLSETFIEQKQHAEAEEQLAALFQINDADSEGLMLRARLRLQEDRGEAAVKDLEEVLKKQPSGRDPLFMMAQAKLAVGQFEESAAFLADLERYHPGFLKAGLIKIQAAFSAGDAALALKHSNDLVAKANAAVPNADLTSEAIQDLRVKGISARGLAHLDLRHLSEAKADLEEVVRVSPRSSAALVNLARYFVVARNESRALDLLEKAVQLDPQNFEAVSEVVKVSIRLGDTGRAHARLDKLITENTGRMGVLAAFNYLKSNVYSAERNIVEAEKYLAAAIELDGEYMPAYSAYASFLVGQNRTDEAIEQYQRLIEKRPAAPIFTMLGILEDSRGNIAQAESAYRRALEIAPQNPIAANNLAWLIAERQGNLDEALQLATGAINRNQANAGFYDTLGWVYLKKGLASPAVEQFRKAVALDESNAQKSGQSPAPGYRLRLGMALATAGDKTAAKREVESSLRHGDVLSSREKQDAKLVLASL